MPKADRAVIFHAGFHKTGTTSVQAALHLHAAALAPHVAIQTRASSPTLRAAADAARDFSATPGAHTLLTDTIAAWAAQVTPANTILVSCEDFSGHMPGRFGVPDYRAALPIARAIRSALGHALPMHRLTFLYTTRAADPWLRAVHWQLSKHDELTKGAARFARTYASAADFAPLLAALRADAPAGQVLGADLADLSRRRLGPVEAIYDAANLAQALRDTLPPSLHANRSPPHDLARVFVKLNRSELPRPEVRRLKRAMLDAEGMLLGHDD